MSGRDFRKTLAARLAETLGDSSTLPLLQLLCQGEPQVDWRSAAQGLGPFASLADDVLGLMSILSTGQPAVGIWEQDAGTGEFVRSRAHVDLWRFCADVDRIPRKGAAKRVAFLGESVARGFFFDPCYSPAGVLQELLSSTGTAVEVVDLAQSNCDPWWLSVVASATKLLEPDALVVFAGNNWRGGPLANTSAEQCAVDGALLAADRGFSELLARQRRRLEALAAQTVTQLSLAASDAGVPLVLVVPEVNVADWTTCPLGTLDLPPLPDADTRQWVEAYRSACEAMERGASADAERLAREAIMLDGGASAASLDLLARAQLHRGQFRDAAASRRRSRDLTVCYLDGTRPVPGVFSNIAEIIRRVGAEVGATIVDLPRVFAEHCRDDAPGRRLFLDYCHLTPEGIRVAMAATAQALAPLLSQTRTNLAELVQAAPSPSAEQVGWGHLLAGIHNAHWGQAVEICSYHFRRAIESHPPLEASAFPQLYDAFRHAAPPPLLSSFDELVRNRIAAVYLLGYGSTFRSLGLVSEHRLLTSLRDACPSLEHASPDPDFVLGQLSEIDLLGPHWSELTDGNRWFRRGFTAVYGLQSVFPFFSEGRRPLAVAVTCRVPGAREAGDLVVELNGCVIGSITADHAWRSGRCTADARLVREGPNQLSLQWPNVARTDVRPALRRNFETGQQLDLRTQFGQLHELRICVG